MLQQHFKNVFHLFLFFFTGFSGDTLDSRVEGGETVFVLIQMKILQNEIKTNIALHYRDIEVCPLILSEDCDHILEASTDGNDQRIVSILVVLGVDFNVARGQKSLYDVAGPFVRGPVERSVAV